VSLLTTQRLSELLDIFLNLKLYLGFINEALRREDVLGSRGIAPPLLTSVIVGGEWSASQTCCFTRGEMVHCLGASLALVLV
jgi:hypothetical protein